MEVMAVPVQVDILVPVALPAPAALSGEPIILTVPVQAAVALVYSMAAAAAEPVMAVLEEMAVGVVGVHQVAPVVVLIVMPVVPAEAVEDLIPARVITAAVVVVVAEA